MKKGILIICCFFFLFNNGFCQLQGDFFKDAVQTGKAELTFIYNDETGCAAMNESGEIVGLMVSMMSSFVSYLDNEYGIKANMSFEKIEGRNFGEFMNKVKTSKGGVFGLSYASITEERKKDYQFSIPFMNNVIVMATHHDVPTLSAIENIQNEFGDKVAYSVESSIYLDKLKQLQRSHYTDLDIRFVKSELDALNLIVDNKEAFTYFDLLLYLEFRKKEYPIKLHRVGDNYGDQFGIPMSLNNDWKPVIDEFLGTFIQSTEYKKAISANIGKNAIRLIEGL